MLTTDADGVDAVAVTESDDGGFAGKLTLTNVSPTQYSVSAKGSDAIKTCALTLTPDIVPPGRSVTVELKSPKACALSESGETATLLLCPPDGRSLR